IGKTWPVPAHLYLTKLSDLLAQDSDTYTNLRIEVSDLYYADGRHVHLSELKAAAQGTLADVTVVDSGIVSDVEPGDSVPHRVGKILMRALEEARTEFYTEAADAR